MNTLTKELRYLVKRARIPRKQVAFACGMNQSHLSELLKGKYRLTTDAAMRLATILDASPRFLLFLQVDDDLERAGWNPEREKRYRRKKISGDSAPS